MAVVVTEHTCYGTLYQSECEIGSFGVVNDLASPGVYQVEWLHHPSLSNDLGRTSCIDAACLKIYGLTSPENIEQFLYH